MVNLKIKPCRGEIFINDIQIGTFKLLENILPDTNDIFTENFENLIK